MKIFKKIKLAETVEGFLTDREGCLLYSLAYNCQGLGSVVEIGSWKGKSTIWLANGIKDKKLTTKIFAIDPHIGSSEHQQKDTPVWTFEDFKENIFKAGVSHGITPILKTSKDAHADFNTPIELLFIDGGHEFEFVNEDYHLWNPLLLDGGNIAFHDTPWPGVSKVVERVFKEGPFKNVYFTDTLMIGQKAKSISSKDRIKNKIMLFLNRQFQAACISKSPKIIRKTWKDLIKLLRNITYYI